MCALCPALQDVYREVQDLLIPSVIPRDAGKKFKMRPVKRKYAFELDDVPREETEYLQVRVHPQLPQLLPADPPERPSQLHSCMPF